MNNNQQSLTAALTAFQSSLERMNMSLVDSFKPSLLASPSVYQPALLEFQRSIAQAMTISPQYDIAAQMQAQLEALTAPVRQMQKIWSASLVSGICDSLVINDTVLKQTRMLQENISFFASAFQRITIHENYVSVPETLIPEDFQYEEVSDTSSINSGQNEEQSTNIKNLSLSNALTLINFFTMVLVFLLTPFYNHAIENTLSEKTEAKSSTPITEEQAQQMLDYLSELADYQQAILTALETSRGSVQGSDLVPSDIGLISSGTDSTPSNADSQCIPLQPDLVEESHPTEADGSENSEPH